MADNDQPTDDGLLGQDIFTVLGLQNLDETQKAALFEEIMATLRNRVIARLFREMNDSDTKTFADLAEKGDQDAILEFLAARQIDLGQMMIDEAVVYKAELIALAEPYLQAAQQKVSGANSGGANQ